MTLDSPITEIKGIGPNLSIKFEKLGITTLKDLLFYVPYKYQDTSTVLPISTFLENGKGTFIGEIVSVKTIYTKFRKQITTVKVKDDSKGLNLTYFNQPYLSKTLTEGDVYLFSGAVSPKDKKSIYNPKFEKYKGEREKQTRLGRLTSIYSETKGLSSNVLRNKIKEIQEEIPKFVTDPIENHILEQQGLVPLQEALEKIHFPRNQEDILQARERLAFDEMLRIAFRIEKEALETQKEKALSVKTNTHITNQFIQSLPYTLTDDQSKSIEIILEEISRTKPMNRLLNGDVGSGKTVVAAIAILNTIIAGYSAVLIAPTTVLAKQHFSTFQKLFKAFNIPTELCISSEKIELNSNAKLIIGTHAILYKQTLPQNIALVVIDEQHRFGVEQRSYLKKNGAYTPHYLTMTATPIPRSLTEVFFGNMDVSQIKEKPNDRKEIKTYFTPYQRRADCFNWIVKKIKESKGEDQAFIVYPLIDESEKTSVKSVLNEFALLKETYLKDVKVEFLHGKLKPKEKDKILENFRNKEFNILMSTTVIEVGLDIPDATIMVIENAERFGLAQLHQLRGRVGRSDKQAFCFVIPDMEGSQDEDVVERLKYFASHPSGFDVADFDLQRRGPGEVFGTKQSGIPMFKVASIHDLNTLKRARIVARELLLEDNNADKISDNLFR
jgi:ATP-dependent DNA helicase RecG